MSVVIKRSGNFSFEGRAKPMTDHSHSFWLKNVFVFGPNFLWRLCLLKKIKWFKLERMGIEFTSALAERGLPLGANQVLTHSLLIECRAGFNLE